MGRRVFETEGPRPPLEAATSRVHAGRRSGSVGLPWMSSTKRHVEIARAPPAYAFPYFPRTLGIEPRPTRGGSERAGRTKVAKKGLHDEERRGDGRPCGGGRSCPVRSPSRRARSTEATSSITREEISPLFRWSKKDTGRRKQLQSGGRGASPAETALFRVLLTPDAEAVEELAALNRAGRMPATPQRRPVKGAAFFLSMSSKISLIARGTRDLHRGHPGGQPDGPSQEQGPCSGKQGRRRTLKIVPGFFLLLVFTLVKDETDLGREAKANPKCSFNATGPSFGIAAKISCHRRATGRLALQPPFVIEPLR